MPNRTIKESCRSSETLNKLSAEAERLFWRLTTVADDYGRFEAHPVLLASTCFPLQRSLQSAKVAKWLHELVDAPLVTIYFDGGKAYGRFLTWQKHQGLPRAKNSKFPAPNTAVENKGDGICEHMRADVPVVESSSFEVVVESSQLLSPRHDVAATDQSVSSLTGEENNTGLGWPSEHQDLYQFLVTQKYLNYDLKACGLLDLAFWDALSEACGGISLELMRREFAKMAIWFRSNRRKTNKGMQRFITNWMVKAANQEGRYAGASKR